MVNSTVQDGVNPRPPTPAAPLRMMLGDCLARMIDLPPASIDLAVADLPYGRTACHWDRVIEWGPLWAHYRRLLKPGGCVVLTSIQPFTTDAIQSNRAWFRYDDVYEKTNPSGFLDANRKPLRAHESILFFAPTGEWTYNPQMKPGLPYVKPSRVQTACYHTYGPGGRRDYGPARWPTSIIRASNVNFAGKIRPTQKPVPLIDYLIRTYSNPGDVVLDNAMGSGTTGVAAAQAGRRFVGIEVDPSTYVQAAVRVRAAFDAAPEPR